MTPFVAFVSLIIFLCLAGLFYFIVTSERTEQTLKEFLEDIHENGWL